MKEINFKIREGNLELRSCNKHLTDDYPHTTAEIVEWFKNDDSCYTIANYNIGEESVDLHFCNSRPFMKTVDVKTFFDLCEVGQKLLERAYEEED